MIPLQSLGIRQSKAEIVAFDVDESEISGDSRAGLLEGTYHATIKKNGTGDYTLTFDKVSRRSVVVIGAVAKTVDLRCAITECDASHVRVVWEGAGTDTDTDFQIAVMQFFKATQN